MRRLILAAAVALLPQLAHAQLQPQGEDIVLRLKTPDVMLVVDVLKQVGCQNVAQLMVCQQAIELLKTIRQQAGEQAK